MSAEIFSFIKDFKVTKADNKHVNTTTASGLIDELIRKFNLPLNTEFYKGWRDLFETVISVIP